eukprot:m.39968 g.39968  ORF g.39968 m.39968 type:complete len:68 (-) comp8027_c0_seq1:1809-2012(-)
MFRGSGMRHSRLPVVAAFFFSCAVINGTVAYMLWGERGERTKTWIVNTLQLPTRESTEPTSTDSQSK